MNISNLDVQITELLYDIGMPPHLDGYKALIIAIRLTYQDENLFGKNITKILYPTIAKEMNLKSQYRVERNIRNAIEVRFDRGIPAMFEQCVGIKSGKVSNAEFIARCVEKLKIDNANGERK